MNSGQSEPNSPKHALWPVMALGAAILILGVAGVSVADVLAFERSAIETGEWWRLVTAHLVHLNMSHTIMNVLAAALLVALYRTKINSLEWLLVFAIGSLVVSVALYLWHPSLARYVGASGVIHGLVTFAAIRAFSTMRFESCVLLIGVAIKLVSEHFRGPAASTEALIGGRVITEAHLYGAIAGFVIGLLWVAFLRREASRPAV